MNAARRKFEQVIELFSPRLAAERARNTVVMNELRAYDAAGKGRRLKNWKPKGYSANGETILGLSELRNRSRDLVRNNPYSKKAVDVLCTNIISTGLMPRPNGTKAEAKRLKEAFKSWANSTACDAGGQLNFLGIQRLVTRSMVESGDVIVRKVKKDNGLDLPPIALQVLEGDFLDGSKTMSLSNGGKIMQGVEFNNRGERVAYWLYDEHPGEAFLMSSLESKRVPADEIVLCYKVDRPGQVRGVPMGVSSFVRIKDLDDYSDAQLVRQKIASCYAIFIEDATASDNFGNKGAANEYEGQRVEPGMIETLPAGKKMTFATPPPAADYEPYTRTILREIACAYGITYEALTGDLSNVNFSSARMGWLEFGRLVEEIQEIVLIPMFLTRVWDWFAQGSIIVGTMKKNKGCEWTSPRRQFVDPAKEVKALVEMVRAGFISWQEAVRQMGYEPDEVAAQLKEDYDLFDVMGFMLSVDGRVDLPPSPETTVTDENGDPITVKKTKAKKPATKK